MEQAVNTFDVAAFAAKLHGSQVRKYTGEPYITHPLRVAGLVHESWPGCPSHIISGALLHDVMEDCGVRWDDLRSWGLDSSTIAIVGALTDTNTKAMWPSLNRSERKLKEVERWRFLSGSTALHRDASLVKLADLLDNAESIALHDQKFWQVYRSEASMLIDVLYRWGAHSILLKKLMAVLQSG